MYINSEETDYCDKISIGQLEIEDEKALGSAKKFRATDTAIALLHYQGNTNGTSMHGGSTFKLTQDLRPYVDLRENDPGHYNEKIYATKGTVIYSGYIMKALRDKDNAAAGQYPLAGNDKDDGLRCFVYGYKYNTIDCDGHDAKADKTGKKMATVLSIADIDYSGPYTSNPDTDPKSWNDDIPFNCFIPNVIGYEDSWTVRNASLIAALCGLEVKYGVECSSATEFGLHDYIIVEPLYTFYYYHERFFCSATDMALNTSESARAAIGANVDLNTLGYNPWTYISSDGTRAHIFDISGVLSGEYPAYAISEDMYFGLDGVTNCIAACQFFRAAAEKGVGDPDLELGDLEREGCGPEVSARWIIHIARTGDGNAMLWAARCYRDGVGVRRDKRLARAWYKRALEAGNDFAVDDFGYYQPHYLTR